MPLPSLPSGLPQPKNIVIFKHDEINVKFPKMGIWVVSTLGDVDVGLIDGLNIVSSKGKPYPILSVKEKWDYNFNPPYVFTGPFGTVDSAAEWAKSHPNQAEVEKAKQVPVSAIAAAKAAAAQPAIAEQSSAPTQTAAQVQAEINKNLQEKLPAIKSEQAKTLKKIDALIYDAKDLQKKIALTALKKAFNAEIDAMNSNIVALQASVTAYVSINPNAPIKDVLNGRTLDKVIEQCIECNAGAQEFISQLVKKG